MARLRSVLKIKAYQDELKTLNQELEERVRQRTIELEESSLDVIWRLARSESFTMKALGAMC